MGVETHMAFWDACQGRVDGQPIRAKFGFWVRCQILLLRWHSCDVKPAESQRAIRLHQEYVAPQGEVEGFQSGGGEGFERVGHIRHCERESGGVLRYLQNLWHSKVRSKG